MKYMTKEQSDANAENTKKLFECPRHKFSVIMGDHPYKKMFPKKLTYHECSVCGAVVDGTFRMGYEQGTRHRTT